MSGEERETDVAKASRKAAQQTDPAPAGHNVADEREQFIEQTFLNVFREVKASKSEIGEIMSGINEAYKRLKPLGFTKGDVKWAFELEEKDSGEIIAMMQRRIRIAKMLGHGLARQIELFDEDRTPLEDRAYEEGLAAGKLRKDAHNPYGMDSPAGQRWQVGMNDGTAFANKTLSDELIKSGADGDPGFDVPEAAE